MDLLVAWIVFPGVLGLLCLGCGFAVEAATGRRMPASLLVPAGFATIVVAGQFTTLGDSTAELTVPLIVLIAVAGGGVAILGTRTVSPPVELVVALGVLFAVYAAPIVLSGQTSLAGYIKLDDTATWLSFTDRIMEFGRDLSGLEPSTYKQTLEFNIGDGYPIGVFVPFGVGVELIEMDAAWLIQPYMAFLAVLIALAIWNLTAPLVEWAWTRGAIAFVASQPALLYGYYLWGGIKELAAAAMVAATAALAAWFISQMDSRRALLPLALTSAALVGILSPGGLIWLLPILVATLVFVALRLKAAATTASAAVFTVLLVVFSLPVVVPGSIKPPTSSPLSEDSAQGNLIEPLEPIQTAGVWLTGDFRLPTGTEPVAYLLIALVFGLAAIGGIWAWHQKAWGIAFLVLGGVVGCTALVVIGSPWVEGKSMATVSAFVLLAALVGAVAVMRLVSSSVAIGLALAISVGVVWSNTLQYGAVNLAPHDQFVELEKIGERIEGKGPALMTEYSPYGARHFLREADPESVSELRFRLIPRLDGSEVEKGSSADTDDLDPAGLAEYRSLVLRRSPAQSRPPSPYDLVWYGNSYEVWQRPEGTTQIPARLPLGNTHDPIDVPKCGEVTALAEGASGLLAATGVSPVVIPLAQTAYPRSWRESAALASQPAPDSAGTIAVKLRIGRPDVYEIWLGESLKPAAEVFVDGEKAGEVRHELNNYGQYVRLGEAQLDAGNHLIEVRIGAGDLHPGSAGAPYAIGPLVVSGTEAADSQLVEFDADEASELCGEEWDWIEAVP